MNLTITLLDGNQQTQTFAALDDAIACITHEPRTTFTIYAPRNVYDAIAKQVFDQENREDYESIWGYRMKKMAMTCWSDLDDFNDLIDAAEERIRKRKQRLNYGGETPERGFA
ncbi:MAG: hypothetical protein RBT80_13590 [Candidatus Vecturithrix sp.]|jgi:hypothetical protein|nr:hypothetical protein [Candidatus Vecturithrix sp.]